MQWIIQADSKQHRCLSQPFTHTLLACPPTNGDSPRLNAGMLGASLQLRRRCIRCCSCSFSSEQAARRSSSESADPQQHADSSERERLQLQSSSSEHGHNSTLPTLEEQAEMNFEILAVMSKSNARFSTRQHIADESDDEEEQNDKKHLAPQHRRFLSHPQIGAGVTANKAPR
jgi:hypothetical protein